ncbi:unnamed protein product [Oncorhynchus mykiss]|uniref:Kinesin motor domain-containing protein n=1 Tax=Oncorhynchus mykiss TaxID=8022 RepID=A0A060XHL6_ONCMY|nr:unnamed protein product [Oncorhynchus mykiss]
MGETSLNDSNVKVAVRVRPMNRREKDLNTKCIVDMEGNQTILHPGGGNLGKGDSRCVCVCVCAPTHPWDSVSVVESGSPVIWRVSHDCCRQSVCLYRLLSAQ